MDTHVHTHTHRLTYIWAIHTPIKWAWEWRSKTWLLQHKLLHFSFVLIFFSLFCLIQLLSILFSRPRKNMVEKTLSQNYRTNLFIKIKNKNPKIIPKYKWSNMKWNNSAGYYKSTTTEEENNTHQSHKIDYILLWNLYTRTRSHSHIYSRKKRVAKEMKNKIVLLSNLLCCGLRHSKFTPLVSMRVYVVVFLFTSYFTH